MKSICLCIEGKHTVILPSDDLYETYILDLPTVEANLESKSYPNRTVVVSGSGDMAYYAAKLARNHGKNALINGVEVKFEDSKACTETTLINNLKLLSLCEEQEAFLDSLSHAVEAAVKACPSKMTIDDARELLKANCPELNLEFRIQSEEDGAFVSEFETASELALRRFDEAIDKRMKDIKSRISFDRNHERISEASMTRAEVADYIHNNPGKIYLINWKPGQKKTTLVTKKLFDMATETNKALLMSSSIALTNNMYPTTDSRNYRTALETGTINEQVAIASTVNSAVLGPAFTKFTDSVSSVYIEEIESGLDILTSDIIGHNFKMKTEGMRNFNSLLNKETVVCLDGNMSQNTVDHIIKNTNKEIVVINATDVDAKEAKKITYYSDRNVAIERITSLAAQNQKVSVYSDFKHKGDESRFEALYLQMVEILFESELESMGVKKFTAEMKKEITDSIKETLNARLVDAAFFKKNKEYIDNPNLLTEEYDLVMSTPAIRNGVSIETKCDLAALIMCGVNNMHDIYQTGYRNRACEETILALTNPRRRYEVSKAQIFSNEVAKKLEPAKVDAMRELLKNDEAAKDIINRIQYLNESRQDFTNNVLCMYELMNDYVIEYDYSKTTKKHETKAKAQEEKDRTDVYNELKCWNSVLEASKIDKNGDNEALDIRDKRLSYAGRFGRFYGLNASSNVFELMIEFDRGGKGMGYVNNLHAVKTQQEPAYYVEAVAFHVLNKLAECIELDLVKCSGEFSKNNFDEFKEWVHTETVTFRDGSSESLIDLIPRHFPDVSIKQSASLVKGLLRELLGLSTERATVIRNGKEVDKRTNDKARHRMLRIVREDSDKLAMACELAYPASCEYVNATFGFEYNYDFSSSEETRTDEGLEVDTSGEASIDKMLEEFAA